MLRAVVLTQYRRVTDGRTDGQTDRQTDIQTDGIAIASTALAMRALRDVKKSSITLNKNSARAFQTSHLPRFYAAPNFLKMGIKMPRHVVFRTTSTIKDEKSAAKFHYIKNVCSKVVVHSIAFRVVSI